MPKIPKLRKKLHVAKNYSGSFCLNIVEYRSKGTIFKIFQPPSCSSHAYGLCFRFASVVFDYRIKRSSHIDQIREFYVLVAKAISLFWPLKHKIHIILATASVISSLSLEFLTGSCEGKSGPRSLGDSEGHRLAPNQNLLCIRPGILQAFHAYPSSSGVHKRQVSGFFVVVVVVCLLF